VVFALWLFSSLSLLYLLKVIDSIVNNQLYNFGLQFDSAWANPYWNSLHLVYVLLAVPAVLSVFGLVASFGKTDDQLVVKHVTKSHDQIVVKHVTTRMAPPPLQMPQKNATVINCKHCGSVIRNPEIKVSLRNGKSQSAYMCPFCHQTVFCDQEGHSNGGVRLEFNAEKNVQGNELRRP
jgi:hypothetical protein